MFRKKKGPGEVQGYNRISRLIEDRQRELGEDGAEVEQFADDTILMGATTAATAQDRDDDESINLLDVRRHATAVEDQPASEAVGEAASVDADGQAAPAPSAPFTGAAYESSQREFAAEYVATRREETALRQNRMPLPDLSAMGGSSLVAVDATWEGKLRSQGDIRVEGTLRGEIDTEATLIVAPHARVHGTVKARNVMLGGDVDGDISCEERLEILPGGSARGQINSGTLVVHEGAYIDSRFQMRRDASGAGV